MSPLPPLKPGYAALLLLCALAGCRRFGVHGPREYVYVVSKATFLRDRVAAVSNKVADVHNGDRLALLQRERRFVQVRTSDGKVGWLEEHAVIDQADYNHFEALKTLHAQDPVVATAILRDELYLHLTAGRKTDHLYLLPENDKLQLLMRSSVEKPIAQGMPAPKPIKRSKRPLPRPGKPEKKVASGATFYAPAPPHPDKYTAPDLDPPEKPLEDWWLVRDQGGHVGWVLARRLDVDVPDQVAQYSEGKKIIGAYQLNTVYDPGGPVRDEQGRIVLTKKQVAAQRKAALDQLKFEARARRARHAGQEAPPEPASPPPPPVAEGRNVPQYVTVTQEFQDGLPFDWDQVRVFTWNTHRHRYETAYRLREQQGYLPVTVGSAHFKDALGRDAVEPTFTIRTTPDGVVTQDPATGAFHAQTVQQTTYRLEGGMVRRADTPVPKPASQAKQDAAPAAASREPRKTRKTPAHIGASRRGHSRKEH